MTRNGALAGVFPQQPARALSIPGAWSEQFRINSTSGPQQGPCVFLATDYVTGCAAALADGSQKEEGWASGQEMLCDPQALIISWSSNLSSRKPPC